MTEPAETKKPTASRPWRQVLRTAVTERAAFRDARRQALPWLAWLRRRTRSSELWLIAVATVVGLAAGALAVLQAKLAHGAQVRLFGFDPDERLSAQAMVEPGRRPRRPESAHEPTEPRPARRRQPAGPGMA